MKLRELEKYYLGDFLTEDDEVTGGELFRLKSLLGSQEEQELMFHNLETRQVIKHENLIELLNVKKETKSSWCSKTHFVYSAYEYFPLNLKKEVAKRKRNGNFFSSMQMLRLMFDAIDVFGFLQSNGIRHSDVNPNLIFLKEDRILNLFRVKLCEKMNGPTEKKVSILNAISSNLEIYSDPESFEEVSKNRRLVENRQNPFK
jgi:serine/threonine protein kinase